MSVTESTAGGPLPGDAEAIRLDFDSPDFLADPYPLYHRLRAADPVHRSPWGDWYLTRYADVAMALSDPRFCRESPGGSNPLSREQRESTALDRMMTMWMIYRDPPAHTRLRGLVNTAFTPQMVEGLRPRIENIVGDLLDDVQDAGSMDIIADLAYPLPVIVISEMLGVPVADRELLKGWSHRLAEALDTGVTEDLAGGVPVTVELTAYFRDLVAEKRKRPTDDLISSLIAAEAEGDTLSGEELLATCVLILLTGHETTKNLIGNGLLALLRNPRQLQKLNDGSGLIKTAVEELLRYDSPVQKMSRWTTEDIKIGDKTIPEGHLVVSLLGAANRDPEQFFDPDRLDITRRHGAHVAFSRGIHTCLGAPLARIEGPIAIGAVLRRMPRLALQEDGLEWQKTTSLRGLERFRVSF